MVCNNNDNESHLDDDDDDPPVETNDSLTSGSHTMGENTRTESQPSTTVQTGTPATSFPPVTLRRSQRQIRKPAKYQDSNY